MGSERERETCRWLPVWGLGSWVSGNTTYCVGEPRGSSRSGKELPVDYSKWGRSLRDCPGACQGGGKRAGLELRRKVRPSLWLTSPLPSGHSETDKLGAELLRWAVVGPASQGPGENTCSVPDLLSQEALTPPIPPPTFPQKFPQKLWEEGPKGQLEEILIN